MKEGHQKNQHENDAHWVEVPSGDHDRQTGCGRLPSLSGTFFGCIPNVDVGKESEEEKNQAEGIALT